MKTLQKLLIVGVSALLLVSCFSKTETSNTWVSNGVNNSASPDIVTGMPSPEELTKINLETEERQRIAKLDTLSADNIKTQTETKDGKTILKDRRLLINFLKWKNVNTVKKLIDGIEEIQNFTIKSNIEFTEADIMTIIAATDIENASWDMCADYTTNSSTLDSKNGNVKILAQLCNPLAAPSESNK